MELIKGYLQKIAQLSLPDDSLKRLLLEILAEDLKIKLDRRQLKIRQGVVTIEASPLIKSEIFIAKTKIITKLKTVLGPKAPIDLR